MNPGQILQQVKDLNLASSPLSLVFIFACLATATYRQYAAFHTFRVSLLNAGPMQSPQLANSVGDVANKIFWLVEIIGTIGLVLIGLLWFKACSASAPLVSLCGAAQVSLTLLLPTYFSAFVWSSLELTRAITKVSSALVRKSSAIGAVICLTDGRRLRGTLEDLSILDSGRTFEFIRPDGLKASLKKSQVEVAFLWNCGERHAQLADDQFTEGPRTLTLKYPYTETFKKIRYHDSRDFRILKVNKESSGTRIALVRRSHLIEEAS